MSEFEEETKYAMRFLCSHKDASTTVKSGTVNYWLEQHSDTVFVQGKLRRVRFTMITPETYKLTTEEA